MKIAVNTVRVLVVLVAAASALSVPAPAQEVISLRSEADRDRLSRLVRALEEGLPYLPGEILVQFEPGVSDADRQASLSVLGVAPGGQTSHWIGDSLLVKGVPADDPAVASAMLSQQPGVAFAQPNYIRRVHAIPTDPFYDRQWNMNEINMPAAWEISRGAGAGVVVAVLDTGLTTFTGTATTRLPLPPSGSTFGSFAVPFARPPDFDFSRVLPGAEFTLTGPWVLSSGQRVLFDAQGHGTHVAGTIVQETNNAIGFAGVAHGATLMPVKVCFSELDVVMAWGRDLIVPDAIVGGCVTSDVVQGIRYALDNGARVLNLSLGGPNTSPAERNAINEAVSRGAFVAVSAGNAALEGNPVEYPASYANDIQGAAAVGATTSRRSRADYSSVQSYVELAAPGGCGDGGDPVWQVGPAPSSIGVIPPRFDQYVQFPSCGTSMAAPHVAGAAVLLYAQGITNPAAIEAALRHFAIDLGETGRDSQFGYGLIDVRATLRGFGLTR